MGKLKHKTRDLTIETITDTHRKYALQMAETYNRHSRPFQFQLLQPVYLKVLSFKQGTSRTLLPRFTGPFFLRSFVGTTAVKLSATIDGPIHNTTFHKNLIKPAFFRYVQDDTPAIALEDLSPDDVPRFMIRIAPRSSKSSNTEPKAIPCADTVYDSQP